MLRSDDHVTGKGRDTSALRTQQAILARQFQDQRRDNEAMESYAMPQFQNLIDGNSVYLEMMNRSMNAEQYFGGIFPGFGDDRRLNGAEFVGDTIRIAPLELATSSLVEKSTIGGRNLNKRKADCIVEECCNDKEIEESEDTAKSNWETSADNSKVSEIQKPDYIQVRARRGQATDSHSLAERARREKINKKMKCLQDLVPGCSKVTGKAGMLEEIINYVQSLQRQVEFLSMKLAAPNPRLNFDMDSFFMKVFPAHVTGFPAAAAPSDMPNLAYLQLDRAQEGAASCGINLPVNPNSSMSIAKEYLDSSCFPESQPLSNWETDLHTLRHE